MNSPNSINSNQNQYHQIEINVNPSNHSSNQSNNPIETITSPRSIRENYSDHSPTRHRTIQSNNQNQLDQDVQAALHFSRARAGTLDLNLNNSNQNQLQHHQIPPSDQLFWSKRDLFNNDPTSTFLSTSQNNNTPSTSNNISLLPPQKNQTLCSIHLKDHQQKQHHHLHQHPSSILDSHHNQFHHLQRSLSEHSIDSSHGAFIDHRPTHIHPSPISRSNLLPINTSTDHHHPSELHHSSSNLKNSLTQPTSLFQSPRNLINDSTSPSISTQVSTEPFHFLLHSNSKPQSLQQDSPSIIRDSLAFISNDSSNRNQIPHRKSSHPGTQVTDSQIITQNFNIQPSDRNDSSSTSLRPSQVEEDVCFPSLEVNRPLSQAQQPPSRLDAEKINTLGHQRGTAGILPHFPFPFNFQALEEFAQAEKETLNLMRNRRILTDTYQTSSNTPGLQERSSNRNKKFNENDDIVPFTDEEEITAEEDYSAVKDSAVRRRKIGFLSNSIDKTDDSGTTDRRTASGNPAGTSLGGRMSGILNQRRLSENIRPISSAQRKLALFEGAGNNLLSGFGAGSTEAGSGISPTGINGRSNHLESRAPLLGSRFNRFQFGGTGSNSGGDGGNLNRNHQVRWMNNQERPYRFSFYSNALPSTIHARSLAEIPGEGQTFEDLFVGRSNSNTPQSKRSEEEVQQQRQINNHSSTQNQDPTHHQSDSTPDNDFLHLSSDAHNATSSSYAHKLDSKNVLSAAQIASINESSKRSPSILPQQPQHQNEANTNYSRKQRASVPMRTDEDAEANTWWLDILSPTDQEMKLLSQVFGIHPLTTEDILMEETREKIELFRNYYLVCFRSFDQDPYSPTYLEPLNIYIVVFREGTLSFHFRAVSHPQNVRRRIKQLKDYINVTSDWISYALIDDITDAFGPLIQSIEYEVDSIDELVLILKDVEQSDMLRRIGTCRKKVMGLLRLMGNKADVVKGLAKRCNENWLVAPKSDIGLYLSDIQDHLVTMTQNLNHYEKILSRSHSNYLAQISIEMTDANNQINDVLSKLTALGSILVPMNLVTGLWGMNVHVPGQDVAEGYAWFIAIVCALVSFGIIGAWLTLRYFKFSNR